MCNQIKNIWKEHLAFIIFLLITMAFMVMTVIWVYHVKVLNAPKVYSDGFGYYVYLPALLYKDFQFHFVEGWEHPLDLIMVKGAPLNKYAVGTAVMESPFFFAAHLISLLRDALTGSVTATGYSNLYQYAVLFGGILYYAVGTAMLYRLLIRYLDISKKAACITCILITYGTNLFHYASYDACFSHVYSYTLFILFLNYLCWYEERDAEGKNKIRHACIFGLLAGLIFMVRNTNILFVLTYVLYGVRDWKGLKERTAVILKPRRAIPIVLTGFITIMPQLLYWHTATGYWFVYSYGDDEPFYWLSPETLNFLFSVRKGLFFWSPILLLSIIGMVCAYKKRKNLYVGLVVFLIAIIYLSSAWWSWFYGGSFGSRVSVDFMCVFAVFIAYLLNMLYSMKEKRGAGKMQGGASIALTAFYAYSAVCIIWTCIMMIAYWYRMIPWDGTTWNHIRAVIEWLR